MTKKTKMILGGVAVLGLAYYLYKRSQDGGMASMSGYSNMDGVRMSRFANMSGTPMGVSMSRFANMSGTPMGVSMSRFANASGLSMSPFAGSTGRQQKCQVMNKDGSSWTYNATYGRCDRYGGTLIN